MNFKETTKFIDVVHKAKCSVVPLLMGHTGIGKTELIKQIAMRDNKDIIVLHVAQLEPSDLIGLYQVNEDRRTDNCPPTWMPYKEYKIGKGITIETPFEYGQGFINPNGGLLFLDEVNRGHEDIRQALYQLLNDKKIHTYELPENYDIVAAANPQGYETYEFDAALINRFAWIPFVPEHKETQDYLRKKYGSSHILSWLNSDQSLLDYGDDFQIPLRALSPRIEENAIKIYELLQGESKLFLRKCLETMIQPEKVQSFLAFREELMHINYKDILEGKKMTKVKELVSQKKMDVLSSITADLANHFNTEKANDTEMKNATEFLATIPPELDMAFVDYLSDAYYDDPNNITEKDFFIKKIGKDRLAKYQRRLG
jgi:hypothetical protein